MAIRANDFSFQYRMAVGTDDLDALLLVAGKANLRLSELFADFIVLDMNLVATGAGEFVSLVRASLPEYAPVPLVARQACLVAFRNRGCGRLGEHAVRLDPLVGKVLFAVAVAIGAGRRAFISDGTVLSSADHQDRIFFIFIVATRALRVAFEDQIPGRFLFFHANGRTRFLAGFFRWSGRAR